MLLAKMRANGVERAVLVQVIYYRWDNRYTAHVLKSYPDKLMAVCRVNPEDPAAPDHLTYWVKEQGFHGVRLSVDADARGDWCAGPLARPLFQRAAELRVPVLILTTPPRLRDLAAMLERVPDVDMVIDHMADCSVDRADEVRDLMALARYPGVYIKIGHIWSNSAESYPWRDTHELVRRIYQAFGAERLMSCTDWPFSNLKTTYAQTLSAPREEMSFFSNGDRAWVLGKTALRLWPFPGA